MTTIGSYDYTNFNALGQTMTQKSHRLVKQVEVNMDLIEKVLGNLNKTSIGKITVPEEGRIASNVIVKTAEGKLILRFYPEGYNEGKLETGNVDFEIETLHYLASKGMKVPNPLCFGNNEYMMMEGDIKIFAYQLLEGDTLKITDLSNDVAKKCGCFLKEMIAHNERFQANGNAPEGDLEYFLKIYQALICKYPELKESSELKEMANFTAQAIQNGQLAATPKGIVHADFFFENIIIDSNGTTAAIDFGDAYYGHVVMDIAIGAMEFCVLEDKSWDLDMFKEFIKPHAEWLKKHNVNADLFYSLLAANCLRFAVYTMPSTLEENAEVTENPYVIRFNKLMTAELKNNVVSAYDSAIA